MSASRAATVFAPLRMAGAALFHPHRQRFSCSLHHSATTGASAIASGLSGFAGFGRA